MIKILNDSEISKIKKVIVDETKNFSNNDKRIWNIETNEKLNKLIQKTFEPFLIEASSFYNSKKLYYNVMGNEVSGGEFGSGGGWHQDTRFKKQKKWFIYLSDVKNISRGPTQFLNMKQTFIIKIFEILCFNFGNRVKNPLSIKLCNNWGNPSLLPKGVVFSADTRLIHRGSPITERNYKRYALTLYVYGKFRPKNMNYSEFSLDE